MPISVQPVGADDIEVVAAMKANMVSPSVSPAGALIVRVDWFPALAVLDDLMLTAFGGGGGGVESTTLYLITTMPSFPAEPLPDEPFAPTPTLVT